MAGQLPVNGTRWRWAAASEIGTSHLKVGSRKQDAFRCFRTEGAGQALCAIVCDGAGSAKFGGEGASLVCRSLSLALRAHFRVHTTCPTNDEIWDSLDSIRDQLAAVAAARSSERRAFASTLVMLVVTEHEVLIVHIGDGAVVARTSLGEWRTASQPQNGEYASTTYFITDDPAPTVRFTRLQAEYDAFSVFSDGIENLAIDQKSGAAHGPFFQTMLKPLDATMLAGKNRKLSAALADFLKAPRVCDRTDDDKSVILISSR